MFKHTSLSTAVCLALALPGAALAEVEISGYLKNETSFFTRDGQVTNEARTMLDDREHSATSISSTIPNRTARFGVDTRPTARMTICASSISIPNSAAGMYA